MKKLVAGIDIGGTFTEFGLVDEQRNIEAKGSIRTAKDIDFDTFISSIVKAIRGMEDKGELAGIGIGAPMGNFHSGCIESASNLKQWPEKLPIVQKISAEFPGIPVVLTNDANAAAIGEMIYGGAKGMKNFSVITLGTGIGSGIVVNGEVLYGHDGFAGEVGHIIVSHNGRECGCGRRGCLETYASATGIVRTVYKLLADHLSGSELRDISFNNLNSKMIFDAAEKGDPIAIEAFAHTGERLGRALADLVAITSPEAIFLFGGLAKAGKLIFEPTLKSMEANMLSFWKGKVKLLPSGIDGENAAVLGAAALAWKTIKEK